MSPRGLAMVTRWIPARNISHEQGGLPLVWQGCAGVEGFEAVRLGLLPSVQEQVMWLRFALVSS